MCFQLRHHFGFIVNVNVCKLFQHFIMKNFKHKKAKIALAGVARWTECWPVSQRVSGSVPGQGTCLGCGLDPQWGCVRGNHTVMFLSLFLPPFSLQNKINKILKKKSKDKKFLSEQSYARLLGSLICYCFWSFFFRYNFKIIGKQQEQDKELSNTLY